LQICLSLRQHDQAAAFKVFGLRDLVKHAFGHCLIQSRLFTGEVAIHGVLEFVGQIGDDIFVRFDAAQQKRLHNAAQIGRAFGIAGFDRAAVATRKGFAAAQIARV
jgi:pantothenate kinase